MEEVFSFWQINIQLDFFCLFLQMILHLTGR